ncbi:hypothetical protein JCM11251_005289 [Rhodosporidiobolus azoricus]
MSTKDAHKDAFLEPALEAFLARFPHPVFVLPAAPLFDSLVSRRRPLAPAETLTAYYQSRSGEKGKARARKQDEDASINAPSQASAVSGPVSPRSSGLRTPAPPLNNPSPTAASRLALSSPAGVASPTPSTFSPSSSTFSPATASPSLSPAPSSSFSNRTTSSTRTHAQVSVSPAPSSGVSTRSTPSTRAHAQASAILSKAFEGPEHVSRGYPALRRSTLLEGGDQASHDPSRTAEGAVAAMREQRARHDEHEREEEAAEAQREQKRGVGRDEREKQEQKELEESDRRHGGSISLAELVRPVWRNSKWTEAMALRKDSKQNEIQHDELDLLAVLSRDDAQEFLAMVTNVLEHWRNGDGGRMEQLQEDVPLARLDHTVLLELNFPPSSVYCVPPPLPRRTSSSRSHASTSSRFAGSAPTSPILPRNPPSFSARPHAVYSASNSYDSPPADQNPPVSPPHHGVQQDTPIQKPFLQVVATLHGDLIVCTTILANMPLPVNVTHRRQSDSVDTEKETFADKEQQGQQPAEVKSERPPIPAASPRSARPSFTPSLSQTRASRPPLTHRQTSRTSLSAASSTGSATTVIPPDHTPSATPDLLSSADRAALLKPRPTDITPQPLQQWFERGESELPPPIVASETNSEDAQQPQRYPRRLPIEMPGVIPGEGGDGTGRGITYPEANVPPGGGEEDATAGLRNLFQDSYTSGIHPFPKGFVREKQSRAQRRGGVPEERRERDNDDREREWQKRNDREKTRAREKKVARETREREGLGELIEMDESGAEDDDGVRAYDEEDERELERLRARTRTGSTNSAGSAPRDRFDADDGGEDIDDERPTPTDNAPSKHSSPLPPPYQAPPPEQYPEPASPPPQSAASSASLSVRPGPTVHDNPPSRPVSEISFGDPFLDTVAQTPCGRLILAFNWSATSLGHISTWGNELRSQVMLMLASPFHEALWMGEDNVLLYNDAYSRILGNRHPAALGKAGAMGWSEVWDVLGPLASEVMRGKTVSFADHCLSHVRNGQLEETYHSWAYITLRDSNGRIIGYTNPSFETTARVIAERRLGTLRELTQLTSLARTTPDFCTKALRALSTNALDLPFSILYTCETVIGAPGRRTKGSTDSVSGGLRRGSEAAHTTTAEGKTDSVARLRLLLQGAVGCPDGHPSAAREVEVLVDLASAVRGEGFTTSSASSVSSAGGSHSTTDDNSTSTVWPFVEALQSRKPVFISEVGQRAKGFTPRGWPEPVKRAVVIPVMTESSTLPKALLIVGLNPRRPWNEVYATFLNLISRGLSTGLLGMEVSEEQARKSLALQELNDARQAFFSNISHELRTPLSLILGPLEDVLSSAGLKGEDRDKLDVVHRNAARLLNMVNTLLDFSRLESGKMTTVYCPIPLGPAVADLAALFRAAIERGGIEFVVNVEEDRWAEKHPFYLASEMLEKLIFNVLGNAFKYTLAGQISVTVKFSPSDATIAIADSGVGIKEEHLEIIFDRFHRIDSSARSFEGSGIGLSLVLELVKAFGGTIEVQSEFGQGTTFTIRLPRGTAHLPPDAISDEAYESVELPPRQTASLSIINDAAAWRVESQPIAPHEDDQTSGAVVRASSEPEPVGVFRLEKSSTTVLVVDDNAQLRSFIGGMLSKMFTVVEVSDGSEALDYALTHPVNLVVSDVAMPRVSGYELLRALRANASTTLVPVIFLSAQAGPEARVSALLEGANDFLTKPFQARELVARVNVQLQLGAMRMELEKRVEERTQELVDSERRLRELADQHQTLAQVSPVGIFETDREGAMVFVNPQFLEISGHPPDASHDLWENDIDPGYLDHVRTAWADAISAWRPDKPSSTFEFRYKNGKWATLQLRSFERGFIGSITDISHQKEVEQLHLAEVEQRATEAERNRRDTEAFLDMSSHELRNPLSGVWQNAEVVAGSLEKYVDFLEQLKSGRSVSPESVEAHLQEVLEDIDAVENVMLCCEHQRRIADDILNVSKLNMGLLSIQVAPFNLSAAVREVTRTFQVQAAQQEIELRTDEDESLAKLGVDWIVADAGRVKQIIYNFLTNALKYTSDSPRKVVTVHVDAFDTAPPVAEGAKRIASASQRFEPPPDCVWVRVGIEDSGKGLTQQQLEVLFARFAQANPKTDQYGGSGLGLYVSKKLVELHRGFIEVESRFGSGSIFRFAIPASRAPCPPPSQVALLSPAPVLGPMGKRSKRPASSNGRAASTIPAAMTSPTDVTSGGVTPIHVLVAEDNLVNQKVLLRQLKGQGFEVTLVSDGKQALDALVEDDRRTRQAKSSEERYNAIRVVLCDIEMPVMDGLEFARQLREREKNGQFSRKLPACAVTGNAREEKKAECIAAGFDDVATKPYRLGELLQQISRLTGLPVSAPR